MMHSLAHSILMIMPVNFIFKKKDYSRTTKYCLFFQKNKEIISAAITATSVYGMEKKSVTGPLLPPDTIWLITTKMETFEVLTISRAQTTRPPLPPPSSKEKRHDIKSQLQTIFKTTGSNLQNFRHYPLFAINKVAEVQNTKICNILSPKNYVSTSSRRYIQLQD